MDAHVLSTHNASMIPHGGRECPKCCMDSFTARRIYTWNGTHLTIGCSVLGIGTTLKMLLCSELFRFFFCCTLTSPRGRFDGFAALSVIYLAKGDFRNFTFKPTHAKDIFRVVNNHIKHAVKRFPQLVAKIVLRVHRIPFSISAGVTARWYTSHDPYESKSMIPTFGATVGGKITNKTLRSSTWAAFDA